MERSPPTHHDQPTFKGWAQGFLNRGDWLTVAEMARLTGVSDSKAEEQVHAWTQRGQMFVVTLHGTDYVPTYGLERGTDVRPTKALSKVMETIGDRKDSWGLACWFGSINSFLGGRRPQDVLALTPEQVIAAAQDEVDGILHG